MKLGEKECDYEIAHFMKCGVYPKVTNTCKYGLTDDDIDFYTHKQNFDEYYCWRGTRIPQWFE